VFRPANLDQNPAKRRQCDIDQVAYWKGRGLEINPDHCADFEIDEQEKNVGELGPSLAPHTDELGNGRPHRRSAYNEERQIVESINQQNPDRVRGDLDPAMKICRGSSQNSSRFHHLNECQANVEFDWLLSNGRKEEVDLPHLRDVPMDQSRAILFRLDRAVLKSLRLVVFHERIDARSRSLLWQVVDQDTLVTFFPS
jgi:hypothetical protein